MLDHDEVRRRYGSWNYRTPQDAASLLQEYAGRWWIAGGWAIDAFVGTKRGHGDLDLGVPREDVAKFVEFVSPRLDVWAADGSLSPVIPNLCTQLLVECNNLWLRASGDDPWEYDVLLEDVRGATWHYRRAPHVTRPLEDCIWTRDGITYLWPNLVEPRFYSCGGIWVPRWDDVNDIEWLY